MGHAIAVKISLLVCFLVSVLIPLENAQMLTTLSISAEIKILVNSTNDTAWEKVEKYPKEKFEIVYMKVLGELSANDTSRKLLLTMASNESTNFTGSIQPCLTKAYSTFMAHCYFVYVVGGLAKFKQLFLQACKADWLNSDTISDALMRVCKDHKRGNLDD